MKKPLMEISSIFLELFYDLFPQLRVRDPRSSDSGRLERIITMVVRQ